MQKVTIYTDGACSGNPGPGGWAAVLIYGEHKKKISGGSKETTNNIMELTAILEALKALKTECEVEVKNKEIWQEIYSLTKKHKVNFNKVKGHSDVELNNRCDELARAEIDKL